MRSAVAATRAACGFSMKAVTDVSWPSSSSSSSAMSWLCSGWRELGAVAVERVGLQGELPGQQVGRLAVLDRGVVGHVDGLGDRAGDERLRRRHHLDVALDRQVALADLAARVGAVEHRIVLGLEVRRALDGHRAADVDVGRLDLALGEAQVREQVEARLRQRLGRNAERVLQEVLAQRPLVEGELDVEGGGQRLLDLGDHLVGEALGLQRGVVDRRRLGERAVADRIDLDLGDVGLGVAERAQRRRHRAVDDLEVAAAGQLLELHHREVGLDAGGVAVHHEADRAGRRDHGGLRVAVAVLLAELERDVPGALGVVGEALVGVAVDQHAMVERHRRLRHLLVAGLLAIGRAAVVAHHAQHVVAVLLVAGERPELARHLGRRRVADAGHDGGERAADRAARLAVIGEAGRHQQAADVGVAEAERAVLVGELRDLLRRELRHQHGDFEHDGPQPHGVLVALDVERAGLLVAERQQGSARRDCRRCRRGTCTPSTGSSRGSGRTPGRCASR